MARDTCPTLHILLGHPNSVWLPWRSAWNNIFRSPATSSLLIPNILLITLFRTDCVLMMGGSPFSPVLPTRLPAIRFLHISKYVLDDTLWPQSLCNDVQPNPEFNNSILTTYIWNTIISVLINVGFQTFLQLKITASWVLNLDSIVATHLYESTRK
jgi:hypothetical protein